MKPKPTPETEPNKKFEAFHALSVCDFFRFVQIRCDQTDEFSCTVYDSTKLDFASQRLLTGNGDGHSKLGDRFIWLATRPLCKAVHRRQRMSIQYALHSIAPVRGGVHTTPLFCSTHAGSVEIAIHAPKRVAKHKTTCFQKASLIFHARVRYHALLTALTSHDAVGENHDLDVG